MIDAHSALRAHLIAASPLRTLLGADHVYWPELPANGSNLNPPLVMPRKAISFRISGGLTNAYLYAQDARLTVRCYGSTSYEAGQVYRALYDRLHLSQNFIVGDVGFHGISESVPGSPLEDPKTGWPYFFVIFDVKVATVAVA